MRHGFEMVFLFSLFMGLCLRSQTRVFSVALCDKKKILSTLMWEGFYGRYRAREALALLSLCYHIRIHISYVSSSYIVSSVMNKGYNCKQLICLDIRFIHNTWSDMSSWEFHVDIPIYHKDLHVVNWLSTCCVWPGPCIILKIFLQIRGKWPRSWEIAPKVVALEFNLPTTKLATQMGIAWMEQSQPFTARLTVQLQCQMLFLNWKP